MLRAMHACMVLLHFGKLFILDLTVMKFNHHQILILNMDWIVFLVQ